MKKTLTAIAIIISLNCFGQTKDSMIIIGALDGGQSLLGTIISQTSNYVIERTKDTVDVIVLCSDTSVIKAYTTVYDNKIHAIFPTFSIKCRAVREKHNTSEGVMDAGFAQCIDGNGNLVSCYHDYWVIIKYLLPKGFMVWQSEIINEKQ